MEGLRLGGFGSKELWKFQTALLCSAISLMSLDDVMIYYRPVKGTGWTVLFSTEL